MGNLRVIIADFQTQLATKLAVGATSGSIVSNVDNDGETIPNGKYCFTLDRETGQKEHIICDLTGLNITNIQSVSRQGVLSTGVVREHRVSSQVIISDFAHILNHNDLLNGTTAFDADTPLAYDGEADMTGNDNKFATVKYVKDTTISGSPDATTTTKGIVKMSTAPASASNPIAVGDNDTRLPTQSENDALVGTSGTPSSSNKFVTNADTDSSATNDKVVRWTASAKLKASSTNVASVAGDVVALDANAKLPAVDGSQLTNINGLTAVNNTSVISIDETEVTVQSTDLTVAKTISIPAGTLVNGASISFEFVCFQTAASNNGSMKVLLGGQEIIPTVTLARESPARRYTAKYEVFGSSTTSKRVVGMTTSNSSGNLTILHNNFGEQVASINNTSAIDLVIYLNSTGLSNTAYLSCVKVIKNK